jgi:hypothetical protein
MFGAAMGFGCFVELRLCFNRKFNIVSIARQSLTYRTHYCISTLLTRWVPLVEQNLPTLPQHLSSLPYLSC